MTPFEARSFSDCGVYDSNWVGRIVVVPPGGRQRILARDLSSFVGADQRHSWLSGSLAVRLEYEYKARPSRPRPWEDEPLEEEERFGAFAGSRPSGWRATP
ncbi:MAG: hypothetical protein HOP15_05385 [Planctomycetes bacterium]|nr:hypothetical protein [Planctomycetota bacterium]